MFLTLHLRPNFCGCQTLFFALSVSTAVFSYGSDLAPLRGIVLGPQRRPIAGAEIRVVLERAEFQVEKDLDPIALARSDREGQFALEIPTSAPVALIAHAPGMRRARFRLVDLPRGVERVGLTLEPGAAIEGVVTDEVGRPLAGARIGPVVLSPDEDISWSQKHVPVWTQTGADGRFRIEGLLASRSFQFLVRKEGYQLENAAARAGTSDLNIRLRRGGSTVRGIIRSRRETPDQFAGARVWLNGNGFSWFVEADRTGHFSYDGLPPGNFSVEVSGMHPRVSRVVLLQFPRDTGKEIVVEVSDGYWINGTVLDATTSAPVGGVGLRCEERVTTSAPDGRFRLGPLWLVGRPAIEVDEASGYAASAPPPHGLERRDETDGFRDLEGQTVWVRPLRRITLVTQGWDLTTRSLHAIFVATNGQREAQRLTTQVQVLRLHSESPGVLWCTDQLEWASPWVALNSSPRSHAPSVTLRLERAASLVGRVVRGHGPNAETTSGGAVVRLAANMSGSSDRHEWPVLYEANTAKDGTFRFPALPPGSYRVSVTTYQKTIERVRDVSLASGETASLVFDLPQGKRFAGLVRDRAGQPLPGVSVRYYVPSSDGRTRAGTVETDAHGRFAVEELEGDSLSLVQVDRAGYVRWERRDVTLPIDELEIVLSPVAALTFLVESAPTESWDVHLMRIEPWGAGKFAKQLVGREIAEARVVGGAQEAFPAPDAGRYRLVAANAHGVIGVSEEIDWNPEKGSERPVVIRPGQAGAVVAEFKDHVHVENGEVVATNMVVPETLPGAERRLTQVAGDSVTMDGLPAGDYLVVVSSDTFNASATNVRVMPGQITRVAMQQTELGSVEGSVRRGSVALASVQVTVKSQTDASEPVRTTTTDETGGFRVDGLPADSYVIEVAVPAETGSRVVRRSLRIPEQGGVVRLDVDVTPPPRIAFVLPAPMHAAPGSPVVLLSRETGDMIRPEWRGGLLEAELSPGTYQVSIGDAPLGEIRVEADGRVEAVTP